MPPIVRRLVAAALALSTLHPVEAAEIRSIVANAVKDGYAELVASFEKASGHTVVTTWAGTENATRRVSGGEVYDIVLIGSASIDKLIADGKLAAGSRTDIAKTGVGVAARTGLPKPDVSTAAAVKAAVLNAGSVAYSAGPSGAYLATLFQKMGIADEIAPKLKRPSSGAEVAQLVSRGEADLGFGQVSEFMNIAGLVDLGPLPAEIQNVTIYAAGLHTSAPQPDAARALLKHLTEPKAAPAIRKMGMEPG